MEANKVDKFYKESLSGFEYKLSGGAFWRKLKWRLFWIDIKYYAAGTGVLAMIAAGLYFGLSDPESLDISNTARVYQRHSIEYQSTIVQTVSDAYRQNESDMAALSDLMNVLDVAESVETENPGIIQDHDRSRGDAYANNSLATNHETLITPGFSRLTENAEMRYGASEMVETPTAREYTPFNEIQPVSTIAFAETKPELLYDSISQLFIPKPKVHFSISLYVSPAYNVPNMKAPGGYDDYMTYRTDNESPSFSLSAGIDFQVNIKNWYVQTGLAYSKFNSYRNYNHTFLAYDSLRSYYTNDTTWGWLFDPPDIGKPVVIGIDTVLVAVYNDLNEGNNEWNYLEIPLLVGYKFNKSRFSFDVATGFSYGLLILASGNVPDLSEQNLFTELSEMNVLLNKNQFNYILQLGVAYHLTPVWSIMAKPFYKQNLISVFDNTYPIDQRFKSFGIQFGLIVDF